MQNRLKLSQLIMLFLVVALVIVSFNLFATNQDLKQKNVVLLKNIEKYKTTEDEEKDVFT